MASGRLTPRDIRIAVLNWNGLDNAAIAGELGVTEAFIETRLRAKEVVEFVTNLAKKTIDTMVEVQAGLQGFSPLALHEMGNLMLGGKAETTRYAAAKSILEMAGHTPVRHVQVERIDNTEIKYEDMSEEQLRANLSKSIGIEQVEENKDETVH